MDQKGLNPYVFVLGNHYTRYLLSTSMSILEEVFIILFVVIRLNLVEQIEANKEADN